MYKERLGNKIGCFFFFFPHEVSIHICPGKTKRLNSWSKIRLLLSSVEMMCRRSYQSRDCEVSGVHLLSEPVNFPSCVDENDCLCDGEGFIQVTQCVQLPFLSSTTREDANISNFSKCWAIRPKIYITVFFSKLYQVQGTRLFFLQAQQLLT